MSWATSSSCSIRSRARACVLLLAHELADPERRRGLRGQVVEQPPVVGRVRLVGEAGPEVEHADQLALADERHDERHARRLAARRAPASRARGSRCRRRRRCSGSTRRSGRSARCRRRSASAGSAGVPTETSVGSPTGARGALPRRAADHPWVLRNHCISLSLYRRSVRETLRLPLRAGRSQSETCARLQCSATTAPRSPRSASRSTSSRSRALKASRVCWAS